MRAGLLSNASLLHTLPAQPIRKVHPTKVSFLYTIYLGLRSQGIFAHPGQREHLKRPSHMICRINRVNSTTWLSLSLLGIVSSNQIFLIKIILHLDSLPHPSLCGPLAVASVLVQVLYQDAREWVTDTTELFLTVWRLQVQVRVPAWVGP